MLSFFIAHISIQTSNYEINSQNTMCIIIIIYSEIHKKLYIICNDCYIILDNRSHVGSIQNNANPCIKFSSLELFGKHSFRKHRTKLEFGWFYARHELGKNRLLFSENRLLSPRTDCYLREPMHSADYPDETLVGQTRNLGRIRPDLRRPALPLRPSHSTPPTPPPPLTRVTPLTVGMGPVSFARCSASLPPTSSRRLRLAPPSRCRSARTSTGTPGTTAHVRRRHQS